MVRGAFGVSAPARPAFLTSLPFVAFFPPSSFAVNLLLQLSQAGQICSAPQPHGPAVAYAQLRGLNPFGHNPAVQGHDGYAYGACSLLSITALCPYSDIYNIFKLACKALFLCRLACKTPGWPPRGVGHHHPVPVQGVKSQFSEASFSAVGS